MDLDDVASRLDPQPVTAAILAEALGWSLPAVRAALRELECRGAARRVRDHWVSVASDGRPLVTPSRR